VERPRRLGGVNLGEHLVEFGHVAELDVEHPFAHAR